MLGIVIGVGAVIAMVAVGAGAQARVAEQIQSLGSNLIIILSGSVNQGGVRLGSGSPAHPHRGRRLGHPARDPARRGGGARRCAAAGQVVYGNLNWWHDASRGSRPSTSPARDWAVIDGPARSPRRRWTAPPRSPCSGRRWPNLFGDADPLGQVIRIKKVPFTVVGVLDRKGQTTWGQDQDDIILIPMTTAKNKVLGGSQAKATRRRVHLRQGAGRRHDEGGGERDPRAPAPAPPPAALPGRRLLRSATWPRSSSRRRRPRRS